MTRSLLLHDLPQNLQQGPKGPLRRVRPKRLFSQDALRRAWLKVRAAGGGPGVDRVSIQAFETDLEWNLRQLQAELLNKTYKPQPVKRLLVPKANQGLRPLALWTLRDKIVQRLVMDCITPYFERTFLPCSFGFRPGLGVHDAVDAVVAQREAYRRWVADVDIQECFDNLDSELVMQLVRRQVKDRTILGLIRSWLDARVFNELQGPGPAGASQGNVISPLLANIVLHQVDLELTKADLHLVRYADDMVICCRRKQDAQQAMQAAASTLAGVKLALNRRKSRVVHFDQGFQFLGHFFLKNQTYPL